MPVSQMGNYQEYLKRMPSPLREVESTPVRQHMFGNPFKIDKVFILLLKTIIFFSFELNFVFEGVWGGVQKTCITLYQKKPHHLRSPLHFHPTFIVRETAYC